MLQVRDALVWPCTLAVVLIAYGLPWVVNSGAGLTLNAYDLAEWMSLHPRVRIGSLPLLAPFLLRMLLVFTGGLIAFSPSRRFSTAWWLQVIGVSVIALALLPAFEFFVSDFSDPNYRQQLSLTILTLVVSAIGLIFHHKRWSRWIIVSLMIAGVGGGLSGLVIGYSLMRDLGLPTGVGAGAILFVVAYLFFGLQSSKRGNSR